MGHNMASWKILEDMLIDLKKKGVIIPENILADLRSAKSMIELHCTQVKGAGDVLQKAEELTANVEAYLAEKAQKMFGPEKVDAWLRRLEEANAEVCEEPISENKFVTGVPRDQKWVRVEPVKNLSTKRIEGIACELGLAIRPQKDGKMIVYGQQENIKEFIKKMTKETAKQSTK
jgi:hypothetical protein